MIIAGISSLYTKFQVQKHRRYVFSQIKRGLVLGSNVMICPGVKFDPPHSFLTTIEDNCIIAPDVRFLNHDASLFRFSNCARIGEIKILKNSFVGAGTLILPGVTIGPDAIVGAYSVVTKSVPADTMVAGNPAKPIKKTSDYIQENIDRLNSPDASVFESAEFYSNIGLYGYQRSVRQKLHNGLGYTKGGDNDLTYHFNVSTEKEVR